MYLVGRISNSSTYEVIERKQTSFILKWNEVITATKQPIISLRVYAQSVTSKIVYVVDSCNADYIVFEDLLPFTEYKIYSLPIPLRGTLTNISISWDNINFSVSTKAGSK